MKKDALLIHCARGGIVNEEDLYEVLKEGHLAGAALDVFENEPRLTPGLADLENIILTPHAASATEETRAKMSEVAALNIIDALEGGRPRNNLW